MRVRTVISEDYDRRFRLALGHRLGSGLASRGDIRLWVVSNASQCDDDIFCEWEWHCGANGLDPETGKLIRKTTGETR